METNLVENDLITLDEVKLWKLDALKDYCKKRGYKVTGTREELCARVYFLYNKETPEDPTAAQVERAQKHDYKKLYSEGPGAISNPDRLKKWIPEKDSMKHWPPISYIDICSFVQRHGCSLSKEVMTSYKTGKAYSLFYNSYIQDISYHEINKGHPCCFLKSDCKHSNRVNDPPHNIWIKIEKESGNICSAYCTCVAG